MAAKKEGQAKKGVGAKKQRSLQYTLIALIFVCWVLPVLLTVGASGYFQARNTRVQVAEVVTESVNNAAVNLRKDLDSVVNDSLNVSYVPTVREAYSAYLQNGNVTTLFNIAATVMQQQYSRNRLIRVVHLLFPAVEHPDDMQCYAYNPTTSNAAQALQFYTSNALQTAQSFMGTLGSDIEFIQDEGHLYMVRVLSLQGNRYNPYAVMVVEINLEELYAGMMNLPWITDMTLYVNNVPLVILGEQITPEDYGAALPGVQKHNLGMENLLVTGAPQGSRFTVQYYVKTNIRTLLDEMGSSALLVIAIALLALPLLGIVLNYFLRKVNHPIGVLSGLAQEIEEGKFGAQIDADSLGSEEFVYLGTQLNDMSARLEDQFERLYREELALRDARIKALQSQINPHFLGNTLETINWEARLAGNVKVSMMMEALSTMLEAALDRRHRPLVHLSEEMMYVNAYLYIIGERLGKRLKVEQEIDETLLDWFVPRLILQPIVENAVEHGVTARQHGRIIIRAVPVDEDWMRLEVENDAVMKPGDEEKVQQLLEQESEPVGEGSGNVGIRNVHQRLRILYGHQSGLKIGNDGRGNTLASMLIGRKSLQQISNPQSTDTPLGNEAAEE